MKTGWQQPETCYLWELGGSLMKTKSDEMVVFLLRVNKPVPILRWEYATPYAVGESFRVKAFVSDSVFRLLFFFAQQHSPDLFGLIHFAPFGI